VDRRRPTLTGTERDVAREIEHHLAASTDYLIEQGLAPDAARAEAIRRFGSPDDARRRLYPYAREREWRMRLRDRLDAFVHDLRSAVRTVTRERGFTALTVLTLALGIGVNAAMFGVLDRLLLRGPDHVRDADRVLRVYYTRGTGSAPVTFSQNGYAAYAALAQHVSSVEAMAAYSSALETTFGIGVDARRVIVQSATWTLFPLLGVQPAAGRFFDAGDDTPPMGRAVAVVSDRLWRRDLDADPAAIGRSILIGGRPFTVVGVAPRGFTGAELRPVDIWIPLSSDDHPRDDWTTTWAARWLHAIVRLKPGVSPEAAALEATSVYRNTYAGRAKLERDNTLSLRPLRYDRRGAEPMEAAVARWVAGVALAVLLVASANVANMLLTRGMRRRTEIAVRAALGISRRRLAGWLATEIAVLVGAGAAAGLLVASWVGPVLRRVLLPDIAWDGPVLDARVLLFAAAATVGTALLVGLAPVARTLRPRLTELLRDGTPQVGRRRTRLRFVLGATQAAFSVVLLVGAGLFVRSFARVVSLDLGIEPDRVLAVSPTWPPLDALAPEQRAPEAARREGMWDRMLAHVRSRSGVESAAAAIGVPFQSMFGLLVRVPGRTDMPELPGGGPFVSAVGPDYFRTVGTRLEAGRVFDTSDHAGSERVAIVSATMARVLWPGDGRAALGQCLMVERQPCARVVGIVEDARRFQLQEEPAMQFYVPIGQEVSISGTTLLVRPAAEHPIDAGTLRRELFALDPTIAFAAIDSLQHRIDPQVRPWRLGAALFAGFGSLAFLIAALGLYSVIASTTAQRTHEIGVRMALGANRPQLVRLVLGDALKIAAAGLGAGTLLALAAAPRLEPLLFETSPWSPAVFAIVAVVLLAAAVAAGAVPARRAARIDPVVTLRA
jgi:predicted permease